MKTTFTKKNYYILIGGILLIFLGYILMIGGGSDNPEVFNPEVFNFQRITLAPIVCLIGFAAIIAAIMWRPKGSIDSSSLKNG
jgi:hypothetical protein